MTGRTPRAKSAIASRIFLALLLTTACGAALSPAFAQEQQPAQDETIVVTGSRIRVDPLAQTQPITQIGQEEIARTGLASTADILQRLPISGGGLNTRNNNSGNIGSPPDGGGVGAGAAEIDLRFLGGRRVLVLVDGLRWVNGAAGSGIPGSVDLNTIPPSMIDRIEVLQEGASPIYGSDAIAGVVNLITRRDQVGLQASAQYGQYLEDGDGQTQEYTASYGIELSPSNHIVFGANYEKQELVSSADRALSAFPAPYATSCAAGGCSSGAVNGRIDIDDPNTGNSLDLTAAVPGAPLAYDPLAPNVASATNSFRAFVSPGDRFNFAPYNYILTPSERYGGFVQFTHDFSNSVSLRVRGSYANRQSANQAAPLPLFIGPDAGTGTVADDTVIDVTNPFNPFGFTLSPGTTYSFIGRRMVEAGPRHFEQEVDTWNVTATLEGDASLFGRDWHWDLNAVASDNNAKQSFSGDINVANMQQALGPAAACTAPCTPLNLFGGLGSITPAMLAFIGYTEHNRSEQQLRDYTANITGDLIDLPAGPLALAAGYEHREVDGSFDPDPVTAAGLTSDIPSQPSKGDFDVDEVYAELRIPLLANQPFFYLLEASVAGRYFDYSTFGSDQTFQGGLRWRPVEEVLLRASWSEGFRAPSIGELFGSASRFDQTIIDPCNNLLTLPLNVQTNCINNGVPMNGSYFQRNEQLPVFTTGNPLLQPETSEAINVGFVWQPSFLEDQAWSARTTFEINYADITIDNAIQAKDSAGVMELCAQTGDPVACASITRSATGAVRGITNPLINVGGIDTRAIDFNISWTSPAWSFGTISVQSNTSHLLEFTERVALGAQIVSIAREGTERGSPAQGYPEWKSQTSVNWDLNQLGFTLTNRYVSSITETRNNNSELDSVSYWDGQLRWTPDMYESRFMFAIGVNNLFDEDTPGCFSCDVNNMDPSIHDVPGRFGYIRLSYKQ